LRICRQTNNLCCFFLRPSAFLAALCLPNPGLSGAGRNICEKDLSFYNVNESKIHFTQIHLPAGRHGADKISRKGADLFYTEPQISK
jgi:hypothetical protein